MRKLARRPLTLGSALSLVLCVILAQHSGCIAPAKDRATPRTQNSELQAAIEAVRQRVIADAAGLRPDDRTTVTRERPTVRHYTLADDFRQYVFTWKLGDGRTVGASYTGTLGRFDPSRIQVGTVRVRSERSTG
jgi:hypothetical protein